MFNINESKEFNRARLAFLESELAKLESGHYDNNPQMSKSWIPELKATVKTIRATLK